MKAVNMSKVGFGGGDTGLHVCGVSGTGRNGEKENQIKNGSVFAGSMAGTDMDRVAQRREQARRQAGKMITDQFAADNELTDTIRENQDRVKQLQSERSALMDGSRECTDKKESLKESYKVEDDSQEQKDLELVEKAQKLLKAGRLDSMEKEDLYRLAEMGPLTEYQERALACDRAAEYFDSRMKDINDEIVARGKENSAIRLGMLKSHGMVDAKKAAGSVLEAASRDMIGMLMNDAKKHMDQDMEKLLEAAKKAAEKKAGEEEKRTDAKEEEEEQEELVEEIQDNASGQTDIRQEVKKILDQAKLLEEEQKGLMVDGQI